MPAKKWRVRARPAPPVLWLRFLVLATTVVVAVVFAMLPVTGPHEAAAQGEGAQARTARGWFTPEQAERGEEDYTQHCARCHGDGLQGDGANPALAGEAFMSRWGGESVHTLFQISKHTMPLDNPNSLGDDSYAAIVAYILEENGFPSGTQELPPARLNIDRLAGLTIASHAPGDEADLEDGVEENVEEPQAPEEPEETEGEEEGG